MKYILMIFKFIHYGKYFYFAETKIIFDSVTKVKVFLGQQAVLPCEAQSTAKIGIEWLKDRKKMYPEKNVYINHDNALVFENVAYQDAGFYECLASNQFIKATKIVELIVTRKFYLEKF